MLETATANGLPRFSLGDRSPESGFSPATPAGSVSLLCGHHLQQLPVGENELMITLSFQLLFPVPFSLPDYSAPTRTTTRLPRFSSSSAYVHKKSEHYLIFFNAQSTWPKSSRSYDLSLCTLCLEKLHLSRDPVARSPPLTMSDSPSVGPPGHPQRELAE